MKRDMRFLRRATLTLLGCACFLALSARAAGAQSVFPTGVTIWDQTQAYYGYTFFPAASERAVLINMNGDVVHSWTVPVAGQEHGETAEPLEDGKVLIFTKPLGAGGFGERSVYELDWKSNVLWTYTIPASMVSAHHDVERLASGNTLILCNQSVSAPSISPINLLDDLIIEVDPAGQIVWTWETYQHFSEFGFTATELSYISDVGGDWAHTNTIEVIPANSHANPAFTPGNIMVSQRHTNIIFIIDRSTDSIVWQVGSTNPLTFGQHHTHMIPMGLPGAGNVLAYDNGSGTGYPPIGRARASSQLIEFDPQTLGRTWGYSAANSGQRRRTFFSDIVGSVQRLPNGNTLTNEGVDGRIFEVATDGTIVWEYMTDEAGLMQGGTIENRMIYRAYRVPFDWPQFRTPIGYSAVPGFEQ